jgi:hypothetical protein
MAIHQSMTAHSLLRIKVSERSVQYLTQRITADSHARLWRTDIALLLRRRGVRDVTAELVGTRDGAATLAGRLGIYQRPRSLTQAKSLFVQFVA